MNAAPIIVEPPDLYLLRWRFDYKDHRPSEAGMWMSDHIPAWNRNSDKVVRAAIEGKHQTKRFTKTFVECDGHVFRNFQWLAISSAPGVIGLRGAVTLGKHNIGLKLLTVDQEILVLINGKVGQRFLTEEEKKIEFATFGK